MFKTLLQGHIAAIPGWLLYNLLIALRARKGNLVNFMRFTNTAPLWRAVQLRLQFRQFTVTCVPSWTLKSPAIMSQQRGFILKFNVDTIVILYPYGSPSFWKSVGSENCVIVHILRLKMNLNHSRWRSEYIRNVHNKEDWNNSLK